MSLTESEKLAILHAADAEISAVPPELFGPEGLIARAVAISRAQILLAHVTRVS